MSSVQNWLRRLDSLFNHNFFPAASRRFAWLRHPLTCLILMATGAGVLAWFVNSSAAIIVVILLAISLLGAAWPRLSVLGLSAEAEFLQTRCHLGEAVTLRLRVTNRMPLPIWGLSFRRGLQAHANDNEGLALACLPAFSETEFHWIFRPPARGEYPRESPFLDTGFPFGLLHAYKPVALRNRLLVWPATVRLTVLPDVFANAVREDRLVDQRNGHSGDLSGIRQFRDGDSMRRVHWAQTARTGKLIVMERQLPVACGFRLIVDLRCASHRIGAKWSSLEQALSIAGSILESINRLHAYVELPLGDQCYNVGSSAADLHAAMDALAQVPSEGFVSDGKSAPRLDRRSRLSELHLKTDLTEKERSTVQTVNSSSHEIIIETGLNTESHSTLENRETRPWLQVGPLDDLGDVFPDLWRRACHVA
jgi:uncharacterized protein (DUF58 family)